MPDRILDYALALVMSIIYMLSNLLYDIREFITTPRSTVGHFGFTGFVAAAYHPTSFGIGFDVAVEADDELTLSLGLGFISASIGRSFWR